MSQLKRAVTETDHHQGPLDASIVLVEYGDYECPYCGEEYPELKAVQREFGDKMCFVFRNFPLTQAHPHAERAAEFAEAAAIIGKFWEMHDMLYEHQQALDDQSLIRYAQRLGFDGALIDSALDDKYLDRIRKDFSGGVRSGVNGTPCIFINGVRYNGERDARTLIELLNEIR
ncbi:MAG TPA: DsbA family protein [Rudaea sp.]|jgi:protein-disulfide isomerase|nr:DsbA family protein [Rudaea sp.]